MRALVFKRRLCYRTDYPIPQPKYNEALIRVTHAGICNTDVEITKGYMGFSGIPGHEFVGVVKSCNKKNLIGKRVAGEINIGCGRCSYCRKQMQNHCPNRSVLGILNKDGVFAEYITLPLRNLHLLSDSILNEEAVFIEPLSAAFEITQQVHIMPCDRVCVLGDGKLGLLVGQVLSLIGCNLVVVGKHKEKLSILKKREIKTRLISDFYNPPVPPLLKGGFEKGFDVVIDCTGSPSGMEFALKIVKPKGKVIIKTTTANKGQLDLNRVVVDEITLIGSRCGPFLQAIKAIEKRKVDVLPLINKIFPLEDGIKAFKYAFRRDVLKVILRID
jgi:threonine dehydrogenase-like Zn-dependent dehydrogenase